MTEAAINPSTRANRRYNGRFPEKRAAHKAVEYAVLYRGMPKLPCVVCSEPKVEAHHEDYSRPLFVLWLCRDHHREIHSLGPGEDASCIVAAEALRAAELAEVAYSRKRAPRKLSAAVVQQIRESTGTGPEVGRRFGVSKKTVYAIRKGTYGTPAFNQSGRRTGLPPLPSRFGVRFTCLLAPSGRRGGSAVGV